MITLKRGHVRPPARPHQPDYCECGQRQEDHPAAFCGGYRHDARAVCERCGHVQQSSRCTCVHWHVGGVALCRMCMRWWEDCACDHAPGCARSDQPRRCLVCVVPPDQQETS